jgi:hypothetical protein
MRQIEARVEAERHDRGRGVGCALPGHDCQFAIGVHADIVIRGREGKDLIQMVAFDPVLEFAGLIAGIGSDLKHGYYDNFDRDRSLGRSLRSRDQSRRGEKAAGKKAVEHIFRMVRD